MLPQRRKSAEEIAKLRESMGIPGAVVPAAEQAPAGQESPALGTAAEHEEAPADGNAPAAEEPDVKIDPPAPRATTLPLGTPKPVRSLRKSERAAIARKNPVTRQDSAAIPARRHSDNELMEMRRIQATPPDQSIAYIHQLAVPWPLVALGYLLPLTGAFIGWFAAWSPGVHEPDFPALWLADLSRQPWLATAGLAGLALFCAFGLLLAGWIAWKKPRSRHHAGFISIITLLVLVFGILQLTSTHGP